MISVFWKEETFSSVGRYGIGLGGQGRVCLLRSRGEGKGRCVPCPPRGRRIRGNTSVPPRRRIPATSVALRPDREAVVLEGGRAGWVCGTLPQRPDHRLRVLHRGRGAAQVGGERLPLVERRLDGAADPRGGLGLVD